jgi:hypothetical protein
MSDFESRLESVRSQWADKIYPNISVLMVPQFTAEDALTATGITASQLHNWTGRDWGFRFAQGNPGKGRRRLFSAMDVITLQLADYLAAFGMVQVAAQWSRTGWSQHRAERLFHERNLKLGLVYRLALVLNADRTNADWVYVAEGSGDEDKIGPAYIRIEFDRLLIETLENLVAILNCEPMPIRNLLQPMPPEKAKAQSDDWFGARDVDAQDRPVKTGLTFEESAELDALEERRAAAQAHDYETGPFTGGNNSEQDARRSELLERHWSASHEKVMAEKAAARAARGDAAK